MAREGVDQPVVFNIIRDEISRKSVPDALLKPGISWRISEQFNETTSHEMEEALMPWRTASKDSSRSARYPGGLLE